MRLLTTRNALDPIFCDHLKNRIELYDNFFSDFLGDAMPWGAEPKIDMSETKNDIVVKAELPGLDAKEIDLSVDRGILTISGEKKSESEEQEMNSFCRETSYGYFKRSIELPADVDEQKIKADYKAGVLKVTLPKANGKEKKVIKIEAH
jgi:HSP20 family protein